MGPILGGVAALKYTAATINMVIDGNSLVAGVGASDSAHYLPALIAALAPISGQFALASFGVGGKTIGDMRTTGYNVDAAYVAGKTNVLLVWEGTNSIYVSPGMTGAAAGSLMGQYCADRLAVHPGWKIIQIGTIARQGAGSFGSIDAANAELVAYNNYLRANRVAMGVKAFVDLRLPGSPFALADYTSSAFENAPYINYEAAGEVTAHIHLNDLGYATVAAYVASALRRLPAR